MKFLGVEGAVVRYHSKLAYHGSALGDIWGGARVGLHIICFGEALFAGVETMEIQARGSPHGPTNLLW